VERKKEREIAMSCGFDCGTYNLIQARRKEDGKIECTKEVNAFIRIPLEDPFTYKMLEKCKVPLIQRKDHAFAVGERAVSLARTFGDAELRRPMSGGCLNPKEKDGYSILATMIHSMIGDITKDGEVLCYSVPANALNKETDIEYHQEVLKQIFSKYSVNGKTVQPYPINEGRALIYAELQDKFLTGIGISFGAGMTNLCFANRSRPAFQFSLVNCGDWIDRQAAKAAAVSEIIINKEKEKINLLSEPRSEVERAIQTQYRILIRNTVKGIKDGLEDVKDKVPDEPIDIVLAGGTASPSGFDVLFRSAVDDIGLPIEVGEIRRPSDHLYAVARGCLEAAEAAEG
jgi:hypothetical protein